MNKDQYDYLDIENLKKLFDQYKENLGIVSKKIAAIGLSTESHNEREDYLKQLDLLQEKISKKEQVELQKAEFIKNKNVDIRLISDSLTKILTKRSGGYTNKITTYSYVKYIISPIIHSSNNMLLNIIKNFSRNKFINHTSVIKEISGDIINLQMIFSENKYSLFLKNIDTDIIIKEYIIEIISKFCFLIKKGNKDEFSKNNIRDIIFEILKEYKNFIEEEDDLSLRIFIDILKLLDVLKIKALRDFPWCQTHYSASGRPKTFSSLVESITYSPTFVHDFLLH